MNQSNDVVVITGGANGIGRGIAQAFAARGMKLALVDFDGQALERTAAELEEAGASVLALRADVRDADELASVAREVRNFGTVRVVCANAGIGGREMPTWQMPMEEWRWVYDLNVFGVIATVQVFIDDLISADHGHIFITSSMQGITTGRIGAYSSSKHAAASFAEILSQDLGAAGSSVKVSCLCPSFTQNALVDDPERYNLFNASEVTQEELQKRKDVVAKLIDHGQPAREVGELVAESVGTDRFWLIPEPRSVERVNARAKRIARDAAIP